MKMNLGSHPLNVLVADNQADILEEARSQLEGISRLSPPHCAETIEEALEIIRAKHLDLAFVDLSFNNELSTAVLQELQVQAPSCEVVVMTRRMDILQKRAGMGLVAPGNRIRGVISKAMGGRFFEDVCVDHIGRRKTFGLSVEGLVGEGSVLEAVTNSSIGSHSYLGSTQAVLVGQGHLGRLRESEDAVLDELVYLLREVFRDAVSAFLGPDAGAAAAEPIIILETLRGGRSDAVVVKGSLRHPDSVGTLTAGVPCVLKFAARQESEEELRRYNSIVKFGVPSDLRVEVMGQALGDTLGVICYSFASESEAELHTLSQWVEGPPGRMGEIIPKLLAQQGALNSHVRYPPVTLGAYFARELHWDGPEALDALHDWLRHLAKKRLLDEEPQLLDGGGPVLGYRAGRHAIRLPSSQVLADPAFVRRHTGALQHGDLHGGNVMVFGEPTRFKLIDYRNVGISPVFLDAISIQSWLRLREADAWSVGKAPEARSTVASVFNRYCGIEASVDFKSMLLHSKPRVAWVDHVNLATTAVLSDASAVRVREYAWAAMVYCLYIAGFETLSLVERLRILVWAGSLRDSIEALKGVR